MPARKRGYAELEAEEEVGAQEPGLLVKLRNDWRMANLMQWLYLFGKEFKIDEDFDMEDLEEECLKPGPSEKLSEIGLSLLKHISSHRGLTLEIFDEYTRRQYLVRRPDDNPFGEDEHPNKFARFDVFTKLKVLHQLTLWTMSNPERFRERMPETRDSEQTQWRIEEFGWDSEDRSYFVLDDNRLYRRTRRPTPDPAPAKVKSKPKIPARPRVRGTRSSKRRRVESEQLEEVGEDKTTDDTDWAEPSDNGLGGDIWECLCVTLEDYQDFLQSLKKSRDPNEKVLYRRLAQDVVPVIEKMEEDRAKKIAKREKELLTLEKLAHAKRSSRIATRVEKEKEETIAREAEEKHKKELAAARKDAQRQREMEDARTSRMMTREQRLKEREYKRILHEEELKKMEEEEEKIKNGEIESKKSERHLKAEMKRAQEALEELNDEEEWVFDCSGCGVYGQNIDDGKHSVACERCNVWQHSACLKLSQEEAEQDDFHFVCQDCMRKEEEARQREEDAKKPKLPPLKFKIGVSSSPPRVQQEDKLEDTVTVMLAPNGNHKRNLDQSTKVKKRKEDRPQTEPLSAKISRPAISNEESQPQAQIKQGQRSMSNGQSQVPPNPYLIKHHSSTAVTGSGISRQAPSPASRPANGGSSVTGHAAQTQNQASRSPYGSYGTAVHATSSVPQTPSQRQEPASLITRTGKESAKPASGLAGPVIPRMPPPQTTPNSSFVANGQSSSFGSQSPLPSTPAHPYVPQKQPSAAPSPIPNVSLKNSSPAINPPDHMNAEARASGISPVKNSSPPRPSSQNTSFVDSASIQGTPIIPPTQRLFPDESDDTRNPQQNESAGILVEHLPVVTANRNGSHNG